MSTLVAPPRYRTLADLIEQIGSIPLERIAACPAPGTATEADVLITPDGEKHLFELVDGVLVEKAGCFFSSVIGCLLIQRLGAYLDGNPLGVVLGAGGTLRLAPGLVRAADVSFLSWSRFPGGRLPRNPFPDLAPDLAIEVLAPGNTEPEMRRKLRDYFQAGVRLIWLIDPETRTARVFTGPTTVQHVGVDGSLDGGEVLPGFEVSLTQLFITAGPRV
jgi:Uma2 family endonuclease